VALVSSSIGRAWEESVDLGSLVLARLAIVGAVVLAEAVLLWLEEHVPAWMGLTQAPIYPAVHFAAAWLLVLFNIALLATVIVRSVHDVLDLVLRTRRSEA
jgi:hypothetical protein